jgi:plasmid stabilization system protein ParE
MILSLALKEEARQDILDAAKWYGEKQSGIDEKFIAAVEEVLNRILKHPETGRKIYKTFRQTLLKKFPYVIVYEIDFTSNIIYAVFHTSQNPRKKLRRLKK